MLVTLCAGNVLVSCISIERETLEYSEQTSRGNHPNSVEPRKTTKTSTFAVSMNSFPNPKNIYVLDHNYHGGRPFATRDFRLEIMV